VDEDWCGLGGSRVHVPAPLLGGMILDQRTALAGNRLSRVDNPSVLSSASVASVVGHGVHLDLLASLESLVSLLDGAMRLVHVSRGSNSEVGLRGGIKVVGALNIRGLLVRDNAFFVEYKLASADSLGMNMDETVVGVKAKVLIFIGAVARLDGNVRGECVGVVTATLASPAFVVGNVFDPTGRRQFPLGILLANIGTLANTDKLDNSAIVKVFGICAKVLEKGMSMDLFVLVFERGGIVGGSECSSGADVFVFVDASSVNTITNTTVVDNTGVIGNPFEIRSGSRVDCHLAKVFTTESKTCGTD